MSISVRLHYFTHVVNKNVNRLGGLCNKLGSIILCLRLFNTVLEITLEGFLSPWALCRVAYGRKRGRRPVLLSLGG